MRSVRLTIIAVLSYRPIWRVSPVDMCMGMGDCDKSPLPCGNLWDFWIDVRLSGNALNYSDKCRSCMLEFRRIETNFEWIPWGFPVFCGWRVAVGIGIQSMLQPNRHLHWFPDTFTIDCPFTSSVALKLYSAVSTAGRYTLCRWQPGGVNASLQRLTCQIL